MSQKFDLIVIGAGPAGYVAAIRAAQLGLKTALVEANKSLGGTCLNVGCIPSKALLDSSEKYEASKHHFKDHGIEVGEVKLNLKKLLGRKDAVVKQLTDGIDMLMKKNKITVINGWATFSGSKEITVGKEKYTADNILIATGSTPVELPFAKFDGEVVVNSTDALAFNKVPKHMVVIGAGVIGLELGSVWRRLGAEVTLVDIADLPVSVMDKDLAKEAKKIFEKQGLSFMLGAKVEEVKTTKTAAEVTVSDAEGNKTSMKADKVLVAVGRRPNTDKLGLDKAGVKTDNRGFIQIDKHFKTSADGVYAVGDCVPGPMLAHKGEEEGIAAVEIMAGKSGHVNYDAISWVVYTEPELAGVGMSEAEAKEQGHEIKVGKFHYRANGRALAMDEADGFVKIIADKRTDKILGMHIIGKNASEMIIEGALAMEFSASSEDLARSVHAHPTLSEVTKEAAMAVDKRQIHG